MISIYFHPLKRLENPSDLPTMHLEMRWQISSSCETTSLSNGLSQEKVDQFPCEQTGKSPTVIQEWPREKKNSFYILPLRRRFSVQVGWARTELLTQLAGFPKFDACVRLHNWQNKTDADSWISWLWGKEVMIYSVHASHFSLDFSWILKLSLASFGICSFLTTYTLPDT